MIVRGITIVWVALLLAVATGLFLLKYEVIALEGELATLNRSIEDDREAIHVLRAEWSYLSDPSYLDRLAGRYLDLVPVTPEHITTLAALPFRPVALPPEDDGTVSEPETPRVLNPGGLAAIPVPGRKPAEVRRPQGPATLVTLPSQRVGGWP